MLSAAKHLNHLTIMLSAANDLNVMLSEAKHLNHPIAMLSAAKHLAPLGMTTLIDSRFG